MTNNPSVKFSEVSRLVGKEWKKMSAEKKQSYSERAREINMKILQETRAEGATDYMVCILRFSFANVFILFSIYGNF